MAIYILCIDQMRPLRFASGPLHPRIQGPLLRPWPGRLCCCAALLQHSPPHAPPPLPGLSASASNLAPQQSNLVPEPFPPTAQAPSPSGSGRPDGRAPPPRSGLPRAQGSGRPRRARLASRSRRARPAGRRLAEHGARPRPPGCARPTSPMVACSACGPGRPSTLPARSRSSPRARLPCRLRPPSALLKAGCAASRRPATPDVPLHLPTGAGSACSPRQPGRPAAPLRGAPGVPRLRHSRAGPPRRREPASASGARAQPGAGWAALRRFLPVPASPRAASSGRSSASPL
nr:translation initiation factor IF-2-like [Aegilops tauschii subsp. strangulata]